jgi:teichuronic acid biosynthesis glycosyltransferase TuaG
MTSVSVVIPCWRAADVVARAVASVAGQTVQPTEVILVDDASGDDTLPAIRAAAQNYPSDWIRVITRDANGGPGLARNSGWEVARGDYIAFLDADDVWHSRKLELQMSWMLAHPEVDLTGHKSGLIHTGEPEALIVGRPSARPVSMSELLFKNPFPTRSVVLRRDLPFRFDGRLVTEDLLMWLQVAAAGKCWVLDAALAYSYRPDFSPGGYSGALWEHELRELRALRVARQRNVLSPPVWSIASAWSLTKFARRVVINLVRSTGSAGPTGPAARS